MPRNALMSAMNLEDTHRFLHPSRNDWTCVSTDSRSRIDLIMHSAPLRPTASGILQKTYDKSIHWPVFADFEGISSEPTDEHEDKFIPGKIRWRQLMRAVHKTRAKGKAEVGD